MRQNAATAAAEGLQERIWDLHDKLSHAILPLSSASARRGALEGGGCVVPKRQRGGDRCSAAVADARSLRAIRAALEDLEGHLHFLRDVIVQQQAERGAAIARLQQSRILLATRLAEHRWRRHRVIEETLAFFGEVLDKTRFASPGDDCGARNQSRENEVVDPNGHSSNIVVSVLSCSLALVKNSVRLKRIGGVLGNAAVFALGMLAFVQLQEVTFHKQSPAVEYRRIANHFHSGSSTKNSTGKHLEVSLARG